MGWYEVKGKGERLGLQVFKDIGVSTPLPPGRSLVRRGWAQAALGAVGVGCLEKLAGARLKRELGRLVTVFRDWQRLRRAAQTTKSPTTTFLLLLAQVWGGLASAGQ